MRRAFIFICLLFCFSGNSFAFQVSDLARYQGVALKQMKKTDTKANKNRQIMGTQVLVAVLGTAKADFQVKYSYVGKDIDDEVAEVNWNYFCPPSWNGRCKGHINYDANAVMDAAEIGDTMLVGKKNDKELDIVIIQQDDPIISEIYSSVGIKQPKAETQKSKPSLWTRLWGTSTTIEESQTAEVPNNEQLKTIKVKDWIRVYFTPGPDCENNIIAEINQAKKIDIAVYSITNQNIVDALVAAKDRGAKVRVITDRLQSVGRYSLVEELEAAGIPVITNVKHKIMHNKFAIFDGKHVESGSYNWTDSATKSNAENCMFFEQEDKVFTKQFNYLWELYQK